MGYQDSNEQRYDHDKARKAGSAADTSAAVQARQEEARRNLTKNDKGASSADDGEPQAKDFGGNLGAYSAARRAWMAKKKSPAAAAVDTLRAGAK